ncbi:uncharacterized protein B0J16DRAFT_328061 [Fusarium flagelliforme]|uniref:uncharacterized protein n=1 Tax=Fusarium flagelliforme TaxID=2675880 RepID=UPI001E8CBDD2|nr:uncharacterized protein B0J16DRAFT_328061 [Fusarium flagelliforme]KAH7197389.1 hypothetical protein B0J16DRAFT_328061 [Fusarium flagelliforme]
MLAVSLIFAWSITQPLTIILACLKKCCKNSYTTGPLLGSSLIHIKSYIRMYSVTVTAVNHGTLKKFRLAGLCRYRDPRYRYRLRW